MDWELITPGIIAGLLVMLTHAPLGREVLRRGVIFIDLAIAQFAALGLIIGKLLHFEHHSWQLQATTFAGALLGAGIMAATERFVRQQEAMIGILFVLAATAAVLVSDLGPHGAQQLKDLLSGEILFLEVEQLWLAGALAAFMLCVQIFDRQLLRGPAVFLLFAIGMGVLIPAEQIGIYLIFASVLAAVMAGMYFVKGPLLRGPLFYLLFAMALTISVEHVGIYLVFASLIIPAYATMHSSHPYAFAVVIGGLAYVVGLVLSLLTDWLAGPLIVWTMAVLSACFGLLSTRRSPH